MAEGVDGYKHFDTVALVAEAMSSPVQTTSLEMPILEANRLMEAKRIKPLTFKMCVTSVIILLDSGIFQQNYCTENQPMTHILDRP
jgi:hypothetical protein